MTVKNCQIVNELLAQVELEQYLKCNSNPTCEPPDGKASKLRKLLKILRDKRLAPKFPIIRTDGIVHFEFNQEFRNQSCFSTESRQYKVNHRIYLPHHITEDTEKVVTIFENLIKHQFAISVTETEKWNFRTIRLQDRFQNNLTHELIIRANSS